jgi:hypothetical protein
MKVFFLAKKTNQGASATLPLARFFLPLLLMLGAVVPVSAQSGGLNQAGLVVVHGNGTVITRCVSFSEAEISGVTLLQRSGLPWQSANGPTGAALCALDGEGCAASDCFCKCKQAPCAYWNYFTGNEDGSWFYAGVGAAVRTLKNGDTDGWVWGDGSASPPQLDFETICPTGNSGGVTVPAQPTVALPTVEVTVDPTISPSATADPTTTNVPSLTPSPTATPTQKPVPTTQQVQSLTNTPEPTPVSSSTATLTLTPTHTSTPLVGTSPAAESPGESFVKTPLAQVGAFALLGAVLVSIYFLQRRR